MSIGTSNFSLAYKPPSSLITTTQTRHINHTIELAADLSSTTSVRSVMIPASNESVVVESRVFVQTSGARGLRSPSYVASQRRNRSSKIRAQIRGLSAHSQREDFTSYTFAVVDDLRKAICYLDEFQDFEGNATTILRHVRNTFFDGGWLLYKASTGRDSAVAVLSNLLVEDPIEPEAVKRSFKLLVEAGLRPYLPSPIDDLDEEDDGGGE